ncbi:PKD domain-containing protein [Aliikangiella coralliicola]|nr:PKD domain-containing protein [Aliikangiella coralliicola]
MFSIKKYLLILLGMTFSLHSIANIQPKLISTNTLSSAPGYELREITFTDANGETRVQELYYIHSREGAKNAHLFGGLPIEEKEELENEMDSWGGDWDANQPLARNNAQDPEQLNPHTWIIDRRGVMISSDAEAEAYANEYNLQQVIEEEIQFPEGDNEAANTLNSARTSTSKRQIKGWFSGWFKKCRGWRNKSKHFGKSIDKNFSHDKRFGKDNAYIDFKGDLKVKADLNLDLNYRYKRRFCIPYKFRVRNIVAKSNYDASGKFSLTGKAQHDFGDFKWEIAKPKVMDSWFMIGPIPVRVAMKLPIEVGTGNIQVEATGQVALVKPVHFKGNFHYTCTTSACTKNSAQHQNLSGSLQNSLGASISASARIKPYLHIAARPFVYGEWFLYAQVGVKPSFPIELYGYWGNLCGDGNNDGHRETVGAALSTIEFEAGITGEAKVFGAYILRPKYWKIWDTSLFFFDFLSPGSSAFSPILRPQTQASSLAVSLPVSIRSCVSRFANKFPVDYQINWGDGQISYLNNVKSSSTMNHTYQSSGTYPVTVSYKNGISTTVNVTVDNDDWGGDW